MRIVNYRNSQFLNLVKCLLTIYRVKTKQNFIFLKFNILNEKPLHLVNCSSTLHYILSFDTGPRIFFCANVDNLGTHNSLSFQVLTRPYPPFPHPLPHIANLLFLKEFCETGLLISDRNWIHANKIVLKNFQL